MRLFKLLAILTSVFAISSCGYSPADKDGSWGAYSGIQDFLSPGVEATVYFAYDSSALTHQAKEILDRQADWLKSTGQTIVVEGHTDERGTQDYNLGLGDRRASAVKRYLVAKGVSAENVNTVTYGKTRPKVLWADAAEIKNDVWAQNRRAKSITD